MGFRSTPMWGAAWIAIVPLLMGVWMTHSARADVRAWIGRLVFTVYWLLLTILLVVPNPIALFRLRPVLSHVPERGVHFAFFAVLAVLACACRFPIRRSLLIVILAVYGLAVESLQDLVPPRQVELLDYVENLLGVVAGNALWWGALAVWGWVNLAGAGARPMMNAVGPLHAEVERMDGESP